LKSKTRKSNSKKSTLLLLFILSTPVMIFPIFEAAAKKGGVVIWRKIRGAHGYRVQIRNAQRKILLDRTVKQNSIAADYPEGKYSIRVSPLKASGRITVWSRWHPLNIVVSRIPVIDPGTKPVRTAKNQKSVNFSVRGRYFLDVIKVDIRSGNKSIPISSIHVRKGGRLLLVAADLRGAAPGSYDLTLTNPRKKILSRKSFFIIPRRIVKGKRPYHNAGYQEYRSYVMNLSRKCSPEDVPDILINSCDKFFVTLNLSVQAGRDVLNFIRITGNNFNDRLAGYEYFAESCRPVFNPARELMKKRFTSKSIHGAPGEKQHLLRYLNKMSECSSKK